MAFLTSAILLGLLWPSPPRLSVDIVFRGAPVPHWREAAAMKEVTHIWAAYGVDVRVSNPDESGRDGAVRLTVRFADRPKELSTTGVLGSIPFNGEEPESTISLYLDAIDGLVSEALTGGRNGPECLEAYRDAIVGRVQGRALAHEIGHFLLRSREHSRRGLMRSALPSHDLMAPNRDYFVLSPHESAVITSRHS